MGEPLTPRDVEHEDDRDRQDRLQEARLEQERYAGVERGGLGGEASARLVERPWVRPDVNDRLAEVFEGRDTGERRRGEDEAA